jgi:hypothetical protein
VKKSLCILALCGVFLSGCLPAFLQPDSGSSSPTPISDSDLEATAAILSELTLQALPTPTLAPSETPVISTPTETISAATASATFNSTVGLTSTTTPTIANTQAPSGSTTVPGGTSTQNPGQSPTLTETLHSRFYGTLPPNLPSGRIILVNKSKREVYISLQCTTPDGYFTILEYPVPRLVETRGPAGKYFYVAWVGGKKLTGKFSLGTQDEVTITINKDAISIK